MRFSAFILSALFLAVLAAAAPLPTELIVNDEQKQCSSFLPGDECMDCTPPDGWRMLDEGASCPENYSYVTVRGNCTGFEVDRCCTEGHSGATGDCRNLVKNNITRECSFAADAGCASLPAGWESMPANASAKDWLCPLNYTWTALPANATNADNSNATAESLDASRTEMAEYSAVTSFGPVNIASVANDADFVVTSDKVISGWTWLTQSGQSATWNFYNLPADRKLYIYLTPLVTRPSGQGGGSGYSTDAKITYSTIDGSRSSSVTLKNTHQELQMPADTFGWGYQTTGYLMIPADRISPDGRVAVTLTKLRNAEDIAVSLDCCTIEYV